MPSMPCRAGFTRPQPSFGRLKPALRVMVLCCAGALTLPGQAESIKVLVQSSPLAGFQYYSGKASWDEMKAGDPLTLVRETDNPHDASAVRIEWRGRKLGYLPHAENRAVAAEMDRGGRVEARIARLTNHRSPWQRVRVEVFVVL